MLILNLKKKKRKSTCHQKPKSLDCIMWIKIKVWVLKRFAGLHQLWQTKRTVDFSHWSIWRCEMAVQDYLVAPLLHKHFSPSPASKHCFRAVTHFAIKGLLNVEREARWLKLPSGSNTGRKQWNYTLQQSALTLTSELKMPLKIKNREWREK